MFPKIEILQELIKSWIIAKQYNATKAADLLNQINDIRLEIALDAEGRKIFYEQLDIPFGAASTYQQAKWFSKNDINYIIRRGVAFLTGGATVSAVNEGNKQRVITREPIAWQQLFSCVQDGGIGQQTLFDFPQEMFFAENEAFGLSITGQITVNGYVFYHGCTIKDNIEDFVIAGINDEIRSYVPEGQQLIPLIFKFNAGTVNSPAVSPTGDPQILTAKNSRSVILTEFSTNAPEMRVSLIDEGRNQLICDDVEARGVAAIESNRWTTWYQLPYPHLLRRGDRLRLKGLNGSILNDDEMAADTNYYFVARGYPV